MAGAIPSIDVGHGWREQVHLFRALGTQPALPAGKPPRARNGWSHSLHSAVLRYRATLHGASSPRHHPLLALPPPRGDTGGSYFSKAKFRSLTNPRQTTRHPRRADNACTHPLPPTAATTVSETQATRVTVEPALPGPARCDGESSEAPKRRPYAQTRDTLAGYHVPEYRPLDVARKGGARVSATCS